MAELLNKVSLSRTATLTCCGWHLQTYSASAHLKACKILGRVSLQTENHIARARWVFSHNFAIVGCARLINAKVSSWEPDLLANKLPIIVLGTSAPFQPIAWASQLAPCHSCVSASWVAIIACVCLHSTDCLCHLCIHRGRNAHCTLLQCSKGCGSISSMSSIPGDDFGISEGEQLCSLEEQLAWTIVSRSLLHSLAGPCWAGMRHWLGAALLSYAIVAPCSSQQLLSVPVRAFKHHCAW